MDNNQLEYEAGRTDPMSDLIESNLDTLRKHFIGKGEYGETPITKDNCEELFDLWLTDLEPDQLDAILGAEPYFANQAEEDLEIEAVRLAASQE